MFDRSTIEYYNYMSDRICVICGYNELAKSKEKVMNDKIFQNKINDLIQEIRSLPPEEQEKMEKLVEETKDRQKKLTKTVVNIQEAIDFLRLSIKYLLFDLEATRRENGYLREMLNNMDDLEDD